MSNNLENHCGAREAFCVCSLDTHPATAPHVCACGGAWMLDATGEFVMVSAPRTMAEYPWPSKLGWYS